MAITSNTLPLAPHLNMYTGNQTTPTRFYETVDTDLKPGDVVILSGHQVTADNDYPAADTVVGVAMEPKAGTESTAGDFCKIALALPGIEFSANMMDQGASGTEADTTAANATAANCLGISCDLDVNTETNVVLARSITTIGNAVTSRFAMQRGPTFIAPSREGATVPRNSATLNPRVIFTFASSIFYQIA